MSLPVTVVLPCRNAERFLPEALASVAAQTVSPGEVIVVDDASDEPVGSDVDAGGLPIRVLRFDRRRGPGPARNAGVAEATHPYIAFLDADDAWTPNKLEIQYDFMRAWPALDATHTEATYVFEDGSERSRTTRPRQMDVRSVLAHQVMCTPTVMIKRSSFRGVGGFDAAFLCTQDWEMEIRMALAGLRVQYLPETLARVRRERHGNHSYQWRCYLAGHLKVLWKHRALFRRHFGTRRWMRRVTGAAYGAGQRAGPIAGALLEAPYRLGL